jgi:hypothetical protein
MRGAPAGFIPIKDQAILNAKSIDSICVVKPGTLVTSYLDASDRTYKQQSMFPEIDLRQPILAVTCAGATWYINCSLPQFAARIQEAIDETK